MKAGEIRDPEAARDWLAAGLTLTRVGAGGTTAVRDGAAWIRAAAAESPALPPPGWLVDVGRLLLSPGAHLRASASMGDHPVLRSYEDQVLGRLSVDPLRSSAADAVRALPVDLRPVAVALFAELVLARVGFSSGVALDPGAVRDLDARTDEEWVVRGAAAARGPAAGPLHAAYADLVACFQRSPRAIEPSEVAILEQLPSLRLRSERLALQQVVDASEALAHGIPRRARPTRRRAGHVSTRLNDESAYPAGGFTSISTTGTPENLVPSELAMMEDGDELDLFDVRYASGELLYYTRDETSFSRGRRRLTIALSPDLEHARVRDPGLPWQHLVLALGLVRALVANLVTQLSAEDLRVRIALPPGALHGERRLLERALAEWIASDVASIEVFTPDALRAALIEDNRRAPTDLVHVGVAGHGGEAVAHTWSAELRVGSTPGLRLPFSGDPALPTSAWDAWRDALARLLAELV